MARIPGKATRRRGGIKDGSGAGASASTGPLLGASDRSGFDATAPNGVGRLPVTWGAIGSVSTTVVDGRALQAFLGSSVDFQAWFMGAVSRAGLRRAVDYQRAGPAKVDVLTGRSGVHVVFAVEAAKKVAMMAGGSRGGAVRDYFIEQWRRRGAGEEPLPPFIGRLCH